MEPQKFGRYVIKGEIGRGGMATVYHAYDPRFEREVAIKVLPHEMLHDVQFRTRFEREAKTIAMLEHPAIVPVYDFGEEEGQPYFVMRFMTGGSLTDRMKGGPVSIQETARLLAHLAPALDEAHAKGIIHRDLKPANILFDQYNEPYVSDFGIAKLASAQTQVTGSAIVGTPAYMSPEQAQGEGIDGRSDIYGLGVILFEMLSGQQPYHGDTPMSVVVKHITDPVPHILDVKPDLPADLERVVEKAMAKDPGERFQNVKMLSDALNAVARGERPVLSSEAPTMVKTIARKGGPPASVKTMLTDKEPRQAAGPVEPRGRGIGMWIGIGAAVLILFGILVGAAFVFKDKIPFLAGPVPTQTKLVVQDTLPPTLEPTQDVALLFTPTDTETPRPTDTPAPTATATLPALPVIGGADKIAFLSDNNIWVAGVDGAGLAQVTQDNTEKRDLQWGPDGDSIYYIGGKCVHYVTASTGVDVLVTCFTSATYLEAFEISPDGKQVAISLDRVLYLVPFDIKALSTAKNWTYLRDMHGCMTYGYDQTLRSNQPVIKQVRWSSDGTRIAANTLSMGTSGRVDLILVFDVSRCDSNVQKWFDNFPGGRFTMTGYAANPVIPFFSWDGQSLFLLNSIFRYKAGYLYAYNYEKQKGVDPLSPLKTCCYQSAVWSPDGTYIAFNYLDIDTNKTELYLIPYGTLGTGASYESFDLPDTFFSKPTANIEIAFRKAK